MIGAPGPKDFTVDTRFVAIYLLSNACFGLAIGCAVHMIGISLATCLLIMILRLFLQCI